MTNLKELQSREINGVAFDPASLSIELQAYGETEAAEKMLNIDSDVHTQISELALKKMIAENVITDKEICLAAIEAFEGKPRNLK